METERNRIIENLHKAFCACLSHKTLHEIEPDEWGIFADFIINDRKNRKIDREKLAIAICECQTTEHSLWKWEYQTDEIKEMYRKRADAIISRQDELYV